MPTEEWIRGPGTPPVVKELFRFADGSSIKEGTGAGVYGQSVGRRLSISLGRCATVFHAEIYAIWLMLMKFKQMVDQINMRVFALTVTTFPLVRQCQKTLNNISTRHKVGLYWVPGHAGV